MQPRAHHIQAETAPPTQRREAIQRVCEAIAREFHPEKIILFGSHAYGAPHTDSDVDLLVVMPFEGSPFRQASMILAHVVQAVGVLPMDLLVRTSEQIRERLQLGDGFMREIIERGNVLYEAMTESEFKCLRSRHPTTAQGEVKRTRENTPLPTRARETSESPDLSPV